MVGAEDVLLLEQVEDLAVLLTEVLGHKTSDCVVDLVPGGDFGLCVVDAGDRISAVTTNHILTTSIDRACLLLELRTRVIDGCSQTKSSSQLLVEFLKHIRLLFHSELAFIHRGARHFI